MIELTSNDYLLCNYVIWLIDACIMLEGNIHAGAYTRGVILGTPSRESNLWELNVLLDSTKQLFKKIGVSTTRIRWSMCLNRIPSYLIKKYYS